MTKKYGIASKSHVHSFIPPAGHICWVTPVCQAWRWRSMRKDSKLAVQREGGNSYRAKHSTRRAELACLGRTGSKGHCWRVASQVLGMGKMNDNAQGRGKSSPDGAPRLPQGWETINALGSFVAVLGPEPMVPKLYCLVSPFQMLPVNGSRT